MSALLPGKVKLEEPKLVEFGTLLYALCKEIISTGENVDKEKNMEYVKQGRYTFLFDSEGRFIQNSMYVPASQDPC